MGILSRPRFLPQQRLDLEDVNALLSALRTDAKLSTKHMVAAQNFIFQGFTVSGLGLKSATVAMADATLIIPENTNDFSYFVAAPSEPNIVIPDADLTDGVRNYIEIQLLTENNTPLTKAFWDPEANSGEGSEFNQTVETITDLKVNMVVLTGGFSGSVDRVPLAIVDVDGSGNIKTILDRRNLFGRLARPANIDYRLPWGSLVEPPYAMTLTGVSGTFVAGETLTINTETAMCIAGGTSSISFNVPSGINFFPGSTVTGGTSGATGTVNTISESFSGVDKALKTQKDINDALMTEFAVVKGTRFWWQNPASSLAGIAKFLESILVQATATGAFAWDGSNLSITDDNVSPANDTLGYIRIMGRSGNLSLTREDGTGGTSVIPIADGEVMYVKIPTTGSRAFSAVGSGDTNYQLVNIASYVSSDTNYWLAYREGSRLYIRGYGEMEPGEEINIGDPELEEILAQIAANLVRANQDRNMKLIKGGTWAHGAPAEVSLAAGLSAVSSFYLEFDAATKMAAQGFTPSQSSSVSRVDMAIRKKGTPSFDVRVSVYTDSAGAPGTLLGHSDVRAASSFTLDPNQLETFTFSTPVAVTSGTTYWIRMSILNIVSISSANNIEIHTSATTDFPGLNASQSLNSGSSWTPDSGRDLRMQVFGMTGNLLSWSSDAYIQIPDLPNVRNRIAAGSAALAADGEVAYVTVNRTAGAPAALTVSVADIDALTLTNDMLIIARRVDNDIIVGSHSFLLKLGEYLELDGALAEINRRLGQLRLKAHEDNEDQARIDASDITQLDDSILSQAIGTFLLKFSGAVIDFTTGTVTEEDGSTPLGTNFTPFTIPSGEYFWYGISLVPGNVDTDNMQLATVQVDPADAADAVQADAPKAQLTGEIKLGAIQVHNNAGNIEIVEVRKLGVGSGSGGGKSIKVRGMNPVATTLPSGASYTNDGLTAVNGDLFLFTNLSSGNNTVYKIGGVGTSITWTAQRVFNGQLTPLDGDSVRILEGEAFADQEAKFNGTDFLVNDVMRFFDGVSANFWELGSIKRIDLANNDTDLIFSVNYLGSENMNIEYSVVRGTAKETGQLYLTTDGTDVAVVKSAATIGDAGIEFSAIINTGVLEVSYTTDNSGGTGSMKFFIKRWSDAATGGPSGVPSYSGSGGGGGSAGGANSDVQFNNAGLLDGDSRFQWDGTLGAINLNGLRVGSLSSGITLADNQVAPALAFQYANSFRFAIVEYSIQRDTDFRVGRLLIANNGSVASLTDDSTDTGTTGITFSAAISGANLNVNFTSTSTGNTATLKVSIRRWS